MAKATRLLQSLVNSETDFVSKRTKGSLNLLEAIAAEALVKGDLDMDVFLEEPFQGCRKFLTAKELLGSEEP